MNQACACRIDAISQEIAAAKCIKDRAEKEARLSELQRIKATDSVAYLPAPILYPVGSDPARRSGSSSSLDSSGEYDDDERVHGMKTGIPRFPLVMMVDEQEKFPKPTTLLEFQNIFGKLPAIASAYLTQMMCKSVRAQNTSSSSSIVVRNKLGMEQFLPKGRITGFLSRYSNCQFCNVFVYTSDHMWVL